jgi:hypothetical protein
VRKRLAVTLAPRARAEHASTASSFAFNVAILLVPTTLMGLSLPLVARAVTSSVEDAGRVVGRLYGINTLGAALGAATAGWVLLGTFGFTTTTRVAGTLNLVAAALVLLVERSLPTGAAEAHDATAEAVAVESSRERVWPWFVVYGLTGAVALGFEQVFFRLIDAVMRSNSYSFAHVLTLYLLLFGIGSATSSRLVRPGRDPRRWFLGLQAMVGISALLALIGLVVVLPALGFEARLDQYFLGDGYNSGFGLGNGWREWTKISVIYIAVPVGLMGLPVLLMGASFPFVQALVADRVETLGRRTGLLLFANICGNVAGTLFVGFVLLDAVGTAGTYRILAVALGVVGVGAVALAPTSTRRRLRADRRPAGRRRHPRAMGAVRARAEHGRVDLPVRHRHHGPELPRLVVPARGQAAVRRVDERARRPLRGRRARIVQPAAAHRSTQSSPSRSAAASPMVRRPPSFPTTL